MTNRILVPVLTATLLAAAPLHAQEVVRKEAPPQIKELVGAVVQAVNGSAAEFESFAQKYFAPELLQKQSAADRAALHGRLSAAFGKIGINGIRRQGPDAPLQMQVKGDKSEGEILVGIDSSDPPKILEFSSNDAPQ
jgi:hypothetical protein